MTYHSRNPNLLHHTSREAYCAALARAHEASHQIRTNCLDPGSAACIRDGAHFLLSEDELSGCVVSPTGRLMGVFSLVRGRGARIVEEAIYWGAETLDCFEGYLSSHVYGPAGFVVVGRSRNWTPGGPDVVEMRLQSTREPARASV